MEGSIWSNWLKVFIYLGILGFLCVGEAYAYGGSLPFNSTIDNFKQHFMSWIFVALIILWIATCLMLAFGDWGEGMKRILNILFWASLALGGPTAITMLFPSAGSF